MSCLCHCTLLIEKSPILARFFVLSCIRPYCLHTLGSSFLQLKDALKMQPFNSETSLLANSLILPSINLLSMFLYLEGFLLQCMLWCQLLWVGLRGPLSEWYNRQLPLCSQSSVVSLTQAQFLSLTHNDCILNVFNVF